MVEPSTFFVQTAFNLYTFDTFNGFTFYRRNLIVLKSVAQLKQIKGEPFPLGDAFAVIVYFS